LKHIRSYSHGAVIGIMGTVVASTLAGCSQGEEAPQEEQNKKIYIEQLSNGKYVVTEEIPTSGPTEAFITEKDGTIRKLSQEELTALAQEEYARVQDGSSETVQSNGGGEGMGLGGTILAAAAGALLGNMVANALMGNKNFQRNQSAATSRSRSFDRTAPSNTSPTKKSFFDKSGPSKTGGSGYYGG